jgi:hypothetical protein
MIGYKELKEQIIPRYARTNKSPEQICREIELIYQLAQPLIIIKTLVESERELKSLIPSGC